MQKRYTVFLSLILFFVYSESKAQTQWSTPEYRPIIAKIVGEIAFHGIVEDSIVKSAGENTDQWYRFIALKKKATTKELIRLTNHGDAAVRCYAFQALMEREKVNLFPIVEKHLADMEKVEIQTGNMIDKLYVGDFFLNELKSAEIKKGEQKIGSAEWRVIYNTLILDKDYNLEAKSETLLQISPDPLLYDRIRDIVNTDENQFGIVALSKYKKDQDTSLIIQRLKSSKKNIQYPALLAVHNFPNPVFYPYLKQIQTNELRSSISINNDQLRALYQAIVQYKTPESVGLLEQTLSVEVNTELKYHSEYIWLALEKYPDPIFAGIKEKIIISDDQKNEFQDEIEQDK